RTPARRCSCSCGGLLLAGLLLEQVADEVQHLLGRDLYDDLLRLRGDQAHEVHVAVLVAVHLVLGRRLVDGRDGSLLGGCQGGGRALQRHRQGGEGVLEPVLVRTQGCAERRQAADRGVERRDGRLGTAGRGHVHTADGRQGARGGADLADRDGDAVVGAVVGADLEHATGTGRRGRGRRDADVGGEEVLGTVDRRGEPGRAAQRERVVRARLRVDAEGDLA